jgi:ATP-dependent protease ClpP protease subunit
MQNRSIYLSFIRPINYDNVNSLLEKINQAIAKGYQDIILMMSSDGGEVVPGFAAYNQLQMFPIHLTTYNIGSLSSIAAIIFLAGTIRIAVPNSTFQFHSAALELSQSREVAKYQLVQDLSELEAHERKIRDVLIARTNLQPAQVELLMAEGKTKNAQFAKDFNIIQQIAFFSIPSDVPIIQV